MSNSDISAPRMNGNTSCAPKSVHTKPPLSCDVRPPPIPSLIDFKTSSPVSSNQIRCSRNNDNRRSVLDPTATAIPSLMSIETRPPWETRLPHNNETSISSLGHLQKTVAEQNDLINVLKSDRKWLEADNNVQRFTVIRLKEQIAEYERYIQSTEAAFALELNKVKQQAKEREEEIQKEQNEKIQAVIARCQYWKKAYYVKEEECTTRKKELDLGRALCRLFVERSLQRASDPSSRLALNMAYGGFINYTVLLEQLLTMILSRGISMSTCTEASRGRTMGRLALPAPEVAAVSPAHPEGEIHFDAASFAYPAEVSFNKALPTDISTLREMTSSVSLSLVDLTSQIYSRLSSCSAPLNPRTRQRGTALLSAPAGAATPTDLAEIYYNKASLEKKTVWRVESRTCFLWLELSTSSKISLSTNDVLPCKTLSQARKRRRKQAITTLEVGDSSPKHPAEEIEVIETLPVLEGGAVSVAPPAEKTESIEATRIDDMASRDTNNSGDTLSVSETIVLRFASNDHEKQLSEANFISGKKKKSRAGQFRRWLCKFICCTSREERKCSDQDETTLQ